LPAPATQKYSLSGIIAPDETGCREVELVTGSGAVHPRFVCTVNQGKTRLNRGAAEKRGGSAEKGLEELQRLAAWFSH